MDNPEQTTTDEQETVETQQLVEFHEIGTVETSTPDTPAAPGEYLQTATDELANSVKGFLARPFQLGRFTWLSANTPFTSVAEIGLPEEWLSRPMIAEKLAGFRYIRANFKIRVQINAQPFNAGRLLIYFIPIYQSLTTRTSSESHFGGITGYQHVDLDLAENTVAELTVPFTANLTHRDLMFGFGSIGAVKAIVYSALTGSLTADGTVWITATDIDIQQPTGVNSTKMLLAKSQINLTKQATEDRKTGAYQRNNAAANSEDIRLAEAKQAGKGRGPLETVAKVVSRVAGAASYIPMVGSIGLAVSWVSDALAGVASLYGWSKPTVLCDTTAVQQKYAFTMANYNGSEHAKVLALDARNSIRSPLHLQRTNCDEMTLSHLTSMDTYLDRFSFPESAVQGQVLWRWPVHPRSCRKVTVTSILPPSTTRIDYNSMLSYVSSTALLWRGTIIYTFHLVKTQFHSGRIRISFTPGIDENYNISTVDASKIYTKIFDIKDTVSIVFEVPFVWNNNWAPLPDLGTSTTTKVCTNIPTGLIVVDVVNSLKRPSTASSSFEILVETRGGDDYELAVPQLSPKSRIYKAYIAPVTPADATTSTVMPLTATEFDSVWLKNRHERQAQPLGKISLEQPLSPVVVAPPSAEKDEDEEDTSKVHPNSRSGMTIAEWYATDPQELTRVDRSRLAAKETWSYYEGDLTGHVPALSGGDPISTNHYFTLVQRDLLRQNYEKIHGPMGPRFVKAFDAWYLAGPAQPQMLDFMRKDSGGTLPAEFGVGEKYVSFRQLCKRKQRLQDIGPSTATQNIRLWVYGSDWMVGANAEFHGAYTWVSSLYRWMSGSMDVQLSPIGSSNSFNCDTVRVLPGFDNLAAKPPNFTWDYMAPSPSNDSAATVIFSSTTEVAPVMHVPFYQPYPALPTFVGQPNIVDYDTTGTLLNAVPHNLGTQLEITTATKLSVWRSIGEDFSFMYVIGPPLTYVKNPPDS